MPVFAFTARDQSGAPSNGTLTAATISEVPSMLRAEGRYPITIAPAEIEKAARTPSLRGIKISRADLIQISTQLAIMLETGVTLSDALECIAQQTDRAHVKALLSDLTRQVHAGSTFSSAVMRHPQSFPRLFVALMAASEKSGMMSRLLGRATNYLRDEQETIRRVRGALTYPAIMLGFAISTTVFLLTFVMPKFTIIYKSKGAALPAPTRILMAISNFLVAHWPVLTVGIVTLIAVTYLYRHTQSGNRVYDYCQLRLPFLGTVFRKLHLARGLRMIGTMAGAGVSLVDSVSTAQALSGNIYFRDLWARVLEQIQSGRQLSEPLFLNPLVPRSVSQMLHVGEKTGKLAMVMEQVSGFSEQELKENIAEMTRYIEPMMIAVMGAIIGGVALALMLPIFTISRVIAQ